jgi:hypothetical protein
MSSTKKKKKKKKKSRRGASRSVRRVTPPGLSFKEIMEVVKDAADRNTVREALRSGDLPGIDHGGSVGWRTTAVAVRAWIEKHQNDQLDALEEVVAAGLAGGGE